MSTARVYNRRRSLPKLCFGVISAYFSLILSTQLIPGIALAEDVLDRLIDIDVAANTPLEDALITWGTKVGVTVMINTETVERHFTPAVHGRLSARKALFLLLRGSGLSYSEDNRTIKVVPAGTLVPSGLRDEQALPLAQLSTDSTLALASSDRSDNDIATGESAGQKEQIRNLETVVVTAEKRSEKLVDVPIAVTAISGDDLQALHVSSLQDLAYYVPGLTTFSGGAPGDRIINIRGLSDGAEGSTASLSAIYVDDLPVGGSSGQGNASLLGIDLNPFDLDHVEVLKGPQGTLYGANAMAGLIKYSLKKPNLSDFEATAGSSLEYIDNSTGPSWTVRGAVSLPIVTDRLALRISAFDKRDAGYIDNLYTGEKGFNSAREAGGLATLLWVPNERLTVNARVVIQNANTASRATVAVNDSTGATAFGGLYVNGPFLTPVQNSTRTYALSVDWNIDFATLTSTSGWSRLTTYSTNGLPLGFFCLPGFLGPGYPGCVDYPYSTALIDLEGSNKTTKFVQEVRLASPENQRLQWLVGGFFTREIIDTTFKLNTYTANVVPLPPADQLDNSVGEGTYKEAAGFADLTFKVTDQFDLTAGGRYSAYSINQCVPYASGLLNYGGTPSPCQALPSTGVTTWMTNARFHLNSDSMLYLRAADGYRPGYGCPTCNSFPGTPGVIKSDEATDYELGLKGLFLNRRLQLDTAVYHILWRGMQTTCLLASIQITYACNAGAATSNGWEFTGAYQVWAGLSVVGTLARTHAYLTKNAPGIPANNGDLLPFEAPWTGSLRVNYTRSLNGQYSLLLGMDYKYKDALIDNFSSTDGLLGIPTDHFAVQNLVDLSAGLTAKTTTLRIYATNVFNRLLFNGVSAGGSGQIPYFVPVQPRTVGLSVDHKF